MKFSGKIAIVTAIGEAGGKALAPQADMITGESPRAACAASATERCGGSAPGIF